jgi:hypothetical protein
VRLIGCLLFLAGTGSLAHAQFFEFLADWSDIQPSDPRPLAGDITATLKARTAWGEITTVESGKYWRNSTGQDRFDDAYGLSNIRDRRGPVIQARIDRQLRRIDIEEKTKEEKTAPSVASTFPANPWSILPFSFKKGGEKTVEGLKATVRTGEDHGVSYEVWTSDQLGLILFARYKTGQTVFEQRVHNIRFAEPDPKIVSFSVPTDFHTHITCSSISAPEWEAPRQTYAAGKDLCK